MSSAVEAFPPEPESPPPGEIPANPWPGLASYTEQDQHLFFGREREISELSRLLRRETLTVLFGRSGSGKTSLLRAGVIPRLRDSYFVVTLRLDYSGAGLHPVEQVRASVLAAAQTRGLDIERSTHGEESDTLWEFFHTAEFWGPRNDHLTPLLIFDQFEEVFTIGRNVKQTYEFLEQLADLIENRLPRAVRDRIEKTAGRLAVESGTANYKVVLSLREDFVPKLDSLRPIVPAIMRNRFALNPLETERAMEVIVEAGGEWVTEDVARDIVAAVAGRTETTADLASALLSHAEIEPAYLSVMCHELFRRMLALNRKAITRDLVAQEQGGILEGLYERSFEGLHRRVRLFVEDRLLTPSGFRGTIPIAEALREGISNSELDTLVDRRLLRFEDRLGTRHIELSHDLLTRVVQNSRDQRRALEARDAEEREKASLREQLVRTRIRGAIAAGAAALAIGTVVFYWLAYIHPSVTYCQDYKKLFGEVEPIDRLPLEATTHRSSSLKIVRQGFKGHVLAVQAVDSAGRLTPNNGIGTYFSASDQQQSASERSAREKECQWRFAYDAKGQVVYEIALDRSDRMVWGLVYSPNERAERKKSRSAKAMFVGPDGYPQPQLKSAAEYVEIDYDQSGHEIKQHFVNREGRPAAGPDGAFGRRHEYDSAGRLIKLTSLDEHDVPIADRYGNATLLIAYKNGYATANTLLDPKGKLIAGKDGWAKTTTRYDRWGNPVERHYFDAQGRPAQDKSTKASIVREQYDDHGNLTEKRFFDEKNNATEGGEIADFAYHFVKVRYDTANFPVSYSYFDRFSRAAAVGGVQHEIRYLRDSQEFIRETQFFDKNGKAVDRAEDFHKVVQKNDEYGEAVEIRYFHADGGPAIFRPGGYHMVRTQYDKRGNRTAEVYFGLKNEPVAAVATNAYKLLNTYDSFGNLTRIEYRGVHDEPVLGRSGYHAASDAFDSEGNGSEEAFYNTADELMIGPFGYAKIVIIHRPDGGQEENDYGPNGDLVVNPLRGFAREETAYRHNGMFFGGYYAADGSLMDGPPGFARHEAKLDSKGQVVEEEFFNAKGQPTPGPSGYYRKDGQKYYDTDNRLLDISKNMVPLIYVSQIDSREAAAAKIGLVAGDVLWGFGSWVYPQALALAQTKLKTADEIGQSLWKGWIAARDSAKKEPASMTVLRGAKLFTFRVESLPPTGLLGFSSGNRQVPQRVYHEILRAHSARVTVSSSKQIQ